MYIDSGQAKRTHQPTPTTSRHDHGMSVAISQQHNQQSARNFDIILASISLNERGNIKVSDGLAGAVMDQETGDMMEYRHLLKNPKLLEKRLAAWHKDKRM